jgi:hypothetical protein
LHKGWGFVVARSQRFSRRLIQADPQFFFFHVSRPGEAGQLVLRAESAGWRSL